MKSDCTELLRVCRCFSPNKSPRKIHFSHFTPQKYYPKLISL